MVKAGESEGPTLTIPRPGYVRGPVERVGRRLKMEYVGMASVFTVICLLFSEGAPSSPDALVATAGSFFLFMGLKKKTRDHLMVSFLLFGSASVAIVPVAKAGWSLPYLLFGVSAWAVEGYLERRRNRIYTLPAALGFWAAIDSFWLLGLVFISTYLTEPRGKFPGLRRRLGRSVATSASAAVAVRLWRFRSGTVLAGRTRLLLSPPGVILLLAIGLPTLMSLVIYWKNLARPHRLNSLLFGIAAPLDERLLAAFGVVAVITLAATVFQNSADSGSMRPFLKHAEWHFFWWVLLLAGWVIAHQAIGVTH